ncbi:hypothetical protein ZEAMMB73_Zm00001d007256, partial [Zea mays]
MQGTADTARWSTAASRYGWTRTRPSAPARRPASTARTASCRSSGGSCRQTQSMSASTSLAKSSSEQSAFVELMAEDSGGWACSPRTRRSNHGRLRQACKLIHAKHFGSPEEDDKVFTKIESNRNVRLRRGPKARIMASGGFGDGEDSPMLGAAAISPLEKANEPVPAVMKGFPLLNLSALHSVRPSLNGRTGADLKLHKNGMSSAAGFLSGGKRSSVVGSYDTNGCNLMLQSILDEQIVSNMTGADPTGVINSVHTTRIVPDASSWSKNIPDEQLVSNKKGVGPSVVLTSAHTAMNMPAACCWSMGQRSFAFEREGQPMDDVRKIERSLHIGAGQVKLPIPPEKKLMPPGKDEDSTLKAMKRASRRNLDGDLSGFKPAGQALRTVSTSSLPIGPFQSGMEQASAVTAINDLSNL